MSTITSRMNAKTSLRSHEQQRGAVLVVSLLLLLVMTILAMAGSQSTRMQERMASSTRSQDLAFQAAEAGLRAGERYIESFGGNPPLACNQPPCDIYVQGFLDSLVSYENQAFQDPAWWDTYAKTYAATPQISGDQLAYRDPQFYIEELEEVEGSLAATTNGRPSPSTMYYRVVSRGVGGTDSAQVVLHGTYALRIN